MGVMTAPVSAEKSQQSRPAQPLSTRQVSIVALLARDGVTAPSNGSACGGCGKHRLAY